MTLSSPIGNITLIGEDGFIVRIRFDDAFTDAKNSDNFVTNSPTSCNEPACSCEIQGDYKAYMIKAAEEIIAYFNREIKQLPFIIGIQQALVRTQAHI